MTNGNGKRRCDNLLATLPLFEIAIVLLRLDYVGSVPVLPLSRNPFVPSLRPNQPNHPSPSQRPDTSKLFGDSLALLCTSSSVGPPIERIRLIPLWLVPLIGLKGSDPEPSSQRRARNF